MGGGEEGGSWGLTLQALGYFFLVVALGRGVFHPRVH